MPHYICNCLMKDAKGKADFSNKHDLCGYCKKNLWGWHFLEKNDRGSFKLKARNEKGSTEARAIYHILGSKNQKEFLSDLKLVYGASTSETGSILCDKFNDFYGFVWKNEIKFVPLPRQERTRWFTPPAVSGTAAWHSSVDIPPELLICHPLTQYQL